MSIIDSARFAQIFPYFRKASPELVEDLLAVARHNKIPAHVTAKVEGDLCTDFVMLLAGELRVFKTGSATREITLYEIGPGDICVLNASSLLAGTRIPAHVATTRDSEVLLISAHDFLRLFNRYEEMRRFVHSHISEGMAAIMTLISEIVFEKMDERLINYLVEKSGNDHLTRTHQQIAQDLGTSREVVSRLLKELEREGHVVLSRNHIELHALTG